MKIETSQIIAWPHTSQFEVDSDIEYQLWLRNDFQREFKYQNALFSICVRKAERLVKHVLDAGTGTGVWAIAAANLFPNAMIDAIDLQESSINLAKRGLEGYPHLKNRVNFQVADINTYVPRKGYDLIITELDGGLGGNEGAKRCFKNLQKMLNMGGILIPSKITTYIAPVDLGDLNDILPNTKANPFLRGKDMVIEDPYACYYLLHGLRDRFSLHNCEQVLDCIQPASDIHEGYSRTLRFNTNLQNLTGFLVWFEQELYGGPSFKFSSAPEETPTSWGQAYLPVHKTSLRNNETIEVQVEECITNLGPIPHYNWRVRTSSGERSYSNKPNQRRRK